MNKVDTIGKKDFQMLYVLLKFVFQYIWTNKKWVQLDLLNYSNSFLIEIVLGYTHTQKKNLVVTSFIYG